MSSARVLPNAVSEARATVWSGAVAWSGPCGAEQGAVVKVGGGGGDGRLAGRAAGRCEHGGSMHLQEGGGSPRDKCDLVASDDDESGTLVVLWNGILGFGKQGSCI